MAERAERLERLEAIFAAELSERVGALEALLLRAQQGEDVGASLLRQLHSLKSAARAVGAAAIEQVAHAGESAIAWLAGRLPPALSEALVASIDAVEPLYRGARDDAGDLLQRLQASSAAAAEPQNPPRSAAEPSPVGPPRADAAPTLRPPDKRNESVRVAVGKLDTLLSESGELSVTHARLVQRLGQLRRLQTGLERWHRDWRR
ncbi:MAG: Hpt domain-containing protein, partial [Chloroflexota bacterium]|nr:Hpt domain-containing protein [Chloroflexota bacterium]